MLAYIYTARLAHVKRATGDVRFKFKALPGLSKTYNTHINDFLAEKKEPERLLSRSFAQLQSEKPHLPDSKSLLMRRLVFTKAESGN